MAGSKQVQRRRGTTAQHVNFTGALGEVTVDTDKKVEVVHDGTTPGGFPMASARDIDATNAAAVPRDSPTGAAKIPKGTPAQRPAAPQPGDFRFNTTSGKFEGYIDATLQWQAVGSDSIPLFSVFWIAKRQSCPAGFVLADGQLLSRATYPEAAAGVVANNVPLAADVDWNSNLNLRGAYTTGDGSTNFRIPDYNGKSAGSLGACFLRGDGAGSVVNNGVIQNDAFQGHTHNIFRLRTVAGSTSYAMNFTGTTQATTNDLLGSTDLQTGSNSYPVDSTHGTARAAAETRPLNVTGAWAIKLFGAVVNPGSADAAQLATDMANLQASMQAQQQQFGYGPGGSAVAPVAYALRNMIINGDMYITSRFGGAGIVFAATEAKYTVDRWAISMNNVGSSPGAQYRLMTFGDLPQAEAGILTYLAIAGVVNGPNGNIALYQHVENVACAVGATVVSFYARRTVAGSVGVRALQQFGTAGGGSPNVDNGFTKLAVTTAWKRYSVSITLPPVAGKTVVASNSLRLCFDVAALGTSVPAGYGGAPAWNDGGEFQITGVQFERGSLVTPFEQIPIAIRMALCDRYYERGDHYVRGYGSNVAGVGSTLSFRAAKRGTPAMTVLSVANTNSTGPSFPATSNSQACVAVVPVAAAPQGFICDFSWQADAEIGP